jgi:hypothetical protein
VAAGGARVRLREAEACAWRRRRMRREARAAQEDLNRDLDMLGRFGNLLIGCTDLAEALQTSEQMLSQLLPDSAGSIYPLLDGEGLAEATHLWGQHAADTRRRRAPRNASACSTGACTWAAATWPKRCARTWRRTAAEFSSACIPLTTQGDSLGWLYLSSQASARCRS